MLLKSKGGLTTEQAIELIKIARIEDLEKAIYKVADRLDLI